MIVVFFPGFDRFIPDFDRSIPSFERFIPANIPITRTLHLKIQMISFSFILFEIDIFVIKKKHLLIPRTNIFLKNTVDTNSKLSQPHFNATGCWLWSTGSDRSQSSVLNGLEEEPSEIAVVQISCTEYIMKFYDDMVDRIPRKHILWPWNQRETHCLHQWPQHLKLAHEPCVMSSEH